MAVALFFSFLNIYFFNLGFTVGQIGIFAAIGPLVTMIGQPGWGVLSDRTNKRRVLIIVVSGAAVMSLVLTLGTSFMFLIIALVIYFSFATAILPLGDAITLQFLDGTSLKYSSIRILGAVSFGLTSVFAGVLLGGNVGRIFWYNSFFLVITLAAVFFMSAAKKDPQTEIKSESEEKKEAEDIRDKVKFTDVIKNKVVLGVYLSSFAFGFVLSFLFAFLGIRMTEMGATEGQVGTAFFIGAFSEIPFFLFIDSFFGNKKPEYILMFSAFFMGVRLFIMFLSESIFLIYVAQAFHGASFIVHLYFCIILLHRHSPEHLKSTVQTIHAMIRMGVSGLLGSISGSLLAQQIGIQNVFLMLAILILSTCFVLPAILIIYNGVKRRKHV